MDVVVPRAFQRRVAKKPRAEVAAVTETVARLMQNTRHPSLQTHKVKGHPGVFEAYVTKANRVTFHYEGGKIVLRNNCNHDRVLRTP